jgi:hypothetical protein
VACELEATIKRIREERSARNESGMFDHGITKKILKEATGLYRVK